MYGVLYSHGWVRSKFHGPSWERLVSDYGVRPRDIMTIRLEHYGTWIGIDFYRVGRGDALSPLPSVGKVLACFIAHDDFSVPLSLCNYIL